MTKQIKKQLRCLLAVLLVMSQMVTMAAAAYTITFNGSVPTTAPTGATVTWNLDTSASGTTNGNTYTVSTESKYDYSDILELVDVPTATLVGYTFRNWADALGSAPSSNDSTNPSYYVY